MEFPLPPTVGQALSPANPTHSVHASWPVAVGLRPAKSHEKWGRLDAAGLAGQHRKPAEAGCGQNWPPHSAGAFSTLSFRPCDALRQKACGKCELTNFALLPQRLCVSAVNQKSSLSPAPRTPDKTNRERSPPNGPGPTTAISKRETASRRQIQPRHYIPGSLDKERSGKDSDLFGERE